MYRPFVFTILLLLPLNLFSQDYYASNKMGMVLQKIRSFRVDEYEYYIEKKKDGLNEVVILYHNSEPLRRTNVFYSPDGQIEKEVILENGAVTERLYKNSLLYYEKEINTDKKGVIRKYKYDIDDRIMAVEETDEKKEETVTYNRDSKGRIVSVERSSNIQEGMESSTTVKEGYISKYRFSSLNLMEEWHGSSDLTGSFFYYNSDGKVSGILKKAEGRVISEKSFTYYSDGTSETEEKIPETDEKIIQTIDAEGLVQEELLYRGGKLYSRTTDFYENKNLIKRIIITEKGTERYLYEYKGDKVSDEKIFFNGEIIREKVYSDDDSYYEDIYSEGRKYLRIYYKDGEKIKTEKW